MGMLSRIKRREIEGFKDFVKNLEITAESRRKEIIQVAVLEDPIFMTWVMRNLIDASEIIKLSSDQVEKVLKALPNGLQVLAKAFFNTKEIDFIKDQVLPRYMVKEFEEYLAAISQLKKAEQEGAQFLIVKMARYLQEKEDIYGPPWMFPSAELMADDKMKSFTGMAEIKFENNVIAARGQIIKNNRQGIWDHYFENGKIMARGSYEQGMKEGPWQFWYLNGKLKAEGAFKYDSKHGLWKEFDQEGNVNVVQYEEGKRLDS
jgi:hypothetical protein